MAWVGSRPGADLCALHKAAIRVTDVLQNLPEGHVTQRDLYQHPVPFRILTALEKSGLQTYLKKLGRFTQVTSTSESDAVASS